MENVISKGDDTEKQLDDLESVASSSSNTC